MVGLTGPAFFFTPFDGCTSKDATQHTEYIARQKIGLFKGINRATGRVVFKILISTLTLK